MLNKRESVIMEIIFNECGEKKSCLIKQSDILKKISFAKDFSLDEVLQIIKTLEVDDYFDVIETEKDGEIVYCFNLHLKGEAFEREIEHKKRAINFKIAMTVLGAVGSVALTFILKQIFHF